MESAQLARSHGPGYARRYWQAEHEILSMQPEWQELKSLQKAPSVPRIAQVEPNPQPAPEQPPTATERGTGQGSKWNPANWFRRQQRPQPQQQSSPASPSVDPNTNLINVPPTDQLREYYFQQLDNYKGPKPKQKGEGHPESEGILDPYAEVSIGGQTLRPEFNEIIRELIPHRKRYLDYLLRQIDKATTPLAKDRKYREMTDWLRKQYLRDQQMAQMTKILRETVPPEYKTKVEESGGTLPPVPTNQKPIVGPVPEIPKDILQEHKRNVQRRRRERVKPKDPAQPVSTPAAPAPAAPAPTPGTVQTKRTKKPKSPATPPPLPKKSAVDVAEEILQSRQARITPWYKR